MYLSLYNIWKYALLIHNDSVNSKIYLLIVDIQHMLASAFVTYLSERLMNL